MKDVIVIIGVLLVSSPFAFSQLKDKDVEPWVANCSIESGDFIEADVRAVAGGITYDRYKKAGWAKRIDGAEGILIVHPVSSAEPAKLRFKFAPAESRGKAFTVKGRGSDVQPGVLVIVKSGSKVLKEAQFDRAWNTIEIPSDQLPAGVQTLTIEIHAMGWNMEYTHIDFVGFK